MRGPRGVQQPGTLCFNVRRAFKESSQRSASAPNKRAPALMRFRMSSIGETQTQLMHLNHFSLFVVTQSDTRGEMEGEGAAEIIGNYDHYVGE